MKVVHMVTHDHLNGVATSCKALIDAQLRDGYDVLLVHRPGAWIAQQKFAGPLKFVESQLRTRADDLRRTGYPLRQWGRDVVHAHGSSANKVLMVYRIADGVPSVMDAHLRHFQLPWLFAHEIIVHNAATASFYLRSQLASRNRIHIVPHLFEALKLSPSMPASRSAARAMLGLKDDVLVVGFVGAISSRKRQGDIVQVLARLVVAGYDAHVVLIGDLPMEPGYRLAFQATLGDPRVANRVHVLGQRTDAVDLVPAFDVFLVASGREEGPIAAFEAMAQGIPVVSTDVGYMADLLPADRIAPIGDIARLTQATARILADVDLRRREGLADRETIISSLHPSKVLPQIEAVYRAAMARARDRGRSKPVPLGWR